MTAADTISVMCACGRKLKAPATAVGKKARCPACGNTLVLAAAGIAPEPATAARDVPLPPPIGIPTAEDIAQDALSTPAEYPETISAPTSVNGCPQCKSPMAAGAVLCVNCGFDTRTGRTVAVGAPAPARAIASGKPAKKRSNRNSMALKGPLLAGTVGSAIAALVASILWVVVAWLTGYAVGYIAIAIGVAAGLGMQAGYKDTNQTGGLIAAAMTVFAIFVAKVVVLEIVIARVNPGLSMFDIDSDKLAAYFLNPIGLVIIVIGVAAAYRTASGSSR